MANFVVIRARPESGILPGFWMPAFAGKTT